MVHHRAILLPLAGVVFLGGCGAAATAPRLGASSVSVRDHTPDGVVLSLLVRADNPGASALPLRDVEYSLELDGREVFRGVRSGQATLRRFGSQEIELPMAFARPSPDVVGSRPYRVRGRMTYLVPGALSEVLFDASVRRPSIGFEITGDVEIPAP